MTPSNTISILIISCDSYEPYWYGFNFCFQKFWDFSLNWPIYFLSEEKDVHFDNMISIKTGKGAWSGNLRRGLNKINSNYIFIMVEDSWIKKKVERGLFSKVFDAVQHYDFDSLRIGDGVSKTHTVTELEKINSRPLYNISIVKPSRYHVSFQAGFWKKEFLLRCLKSNETAWQGELIGTSRLIQSRKKFPYKIGVYIYDYHINAVIKGKLKQYATDLLNSVGG